MDIKIKKEDMLIGVQKAASIIPSKTGAAFLRTIWLETDQDKLKIMSTDSKLEFSGLYPAQITQAGLVGIQGRNLYELLRKLPPGLIRMKLDQESESVLIEQNKGKYKLPTFDSSWFQNFHEFSLEGAVPWSGAELKAVIDRVAFCISEDNSENMHYMQICPMSSYPGWIEVCGMNFHQFALAHFEHVQLSELLTENGVLIAKPYIQELRKWLKNEKIYFNMDSNRVFVTTGEQDEYFSLPQSIDTFPDYKNFLTYFEDENIFMQINKNELTDSLDRLRIFNTETQQSSYFIFSDNELIIYTEGHDTGEATESIEISYNGNMEKIVFPTRDILEILSHFNSEILNFEYTYSLGPCKIYGENDPGYFVVTMPVDITEEVYYEEENI